MDHNNKASRILTRREALITSLGVIGGILSLPGCKRPAPPTYGNILRMGDDFTYSAQRSLLPELSLAKEYNLGDISSFPATGTINPGDSSKPGFNENYSKALDTNFDQWRMPVEGSVAKPRSFSLHELQSFPVRNQITKHTCEEGWTAIAQWHGVQLSRILQAVGIKPSARFVNFQTYDGWTDSIDMIDAFHPQTILAYGMNGKNLPIPHGAPVRLRVEKQIGYKSFKYIEKIIITDEFVDTGDSGWAWYVGM
ncbi:molybdopterin-dependent oxidoreductase [Pollutibacter soli]|uniref:molybdopterin-dependent oxidoreductase n=1 Tax=Pollutibacter soli TaxID=3034157 RepID=UPI00301376F1